MNRNTLLLLGVFALGCAAGLHADSRAHAQAGFPAGTSMQRWQQYCEEFVTLDELNAHVRKAGNERWELAGMSSGTARLFACFKRPGP